MHVQFDISAQAVHETVQGDIARENQMNDTPQIKEEERY